MLRAVCETPLSVYTNAAGLTVVIMHENVAKTHACIRAKSIMDAYPGSPFYITITDFGRFDVHFPKHQQFGEAANAPVMMVHIKDTRY